MEEKDIWTDVFRAIRRMKDLENDLQAAMLERDQEIVDLHKNGVPVAQIARRISLSRQSVHKILAQHGAKN